MTRGSPVRWFPISKQPRQHYARRHTCGWALIGAVVIALLSIVHGANLLFTSRAIWLPCCRCRPSVAIIAAQAASRPKGFSRRGPRVRGDKRSVQPPSPQKNSGESKVKTRHRSKQLKDKLPVGSAFPGSEQSHNTDTLAVGRTSTALDPAPAGGLFGALSNAVSGTVGLVSQAAAVAAGSICNAAAEADYWRATEVAKPFLRWELGEDIEVEAPIEKHFLSIPEDKQATLSLTLPVHASSGTCQVKLEAVVPIPSGEMQLKKLQLDGKVIDLSLPPSVNTWLEWESLADDSRQARLAAARGKKFVKENVIVQGDVIDV